jgi:hypothetical protein
MNLLQDDHLKIEPAVVRRGRSQQPEGRYRIKIGCAVVYVQIEDHQLGAAAEDFRFARLLFPVIAQKTEPAP